MATYISKRFKGKFWDLTVVLAVINNVSNTVVVLGTVTLNAP